MADETIRKEMDALKADIAQLREDIVGLTHAVKSAASERVAGARTQAGEYAHGAWENIEQRFEDLVNQGKETLNKAEHKVGEHPVASVVTAFGIGFLIAKLLDMRGRH